MSVGVPVQLLLEAQAHVVTVETKAGDMYRGTVVQAEDNMNLMLRKVTQTRRDGKVSTMDYVFIRGSQVRFMVLPDMLSNAPMFKRLEDLKEGRPTARGRGLGRGRGFTGRGGLRGRGQSTGPR